MPVPTFAPQGDFGERPGQRTSASFLGEIARQVESSRLEGDWPIAVESGECGNVIGIERESFDLWRFKLTANLSSGGSAAAYRVIYDSAADTWTRVGETITVYDGLGVADGSTIARTNDTGLCKWHPDNGRLEVVRAAGFATDIFLARIDCRKSVSSVWNYSWTEMERLTKMVNPPTVKSGGRVGNLAPFATVTQTQVGTGSLPSIQTVSFCGPTPRSGTWTITTSAGTTAAIAFDANAGAVQSAIQAVGGAVSGVTVTGGPLPTSFVCTFPSNGAQTAFTATVSSLLPATSAWPAQEINNQPIKVGLYVWMRRSYTPTTPASVVCTKTASGNDEGVNAAFSLYTNGATAGSYTVRIDALTAATIYYGQTAAVIEAAIEAASGLTLSTFSGAGTLASPWTFTITSNTADHNIVVNGGGLLDDSSYECIKPVTDCGYEDVTGYDSTATMLVLTVVPSTGCLLLVEPEECP